MSRFSTSLPRLAKCSIALVPRKPEPPVISTRTPDQSTTRSCCVRGLYACSSATQKKPASPTNQRSQSLAGRPQQAAMNLARFEYRIIPPKKRRTPLRRCPFRRRAHPLLSDDPSRLKHRLDPLIRDGETFFQGSRWLPFEDAPKPDVVRIPASHPLWLREVVPLSNRLSGDLTNHVHQLVHGD